MKFTMFVMGVVIGSVVTWQYLKNKYEQIAQDEIDSVKEVFSKRDIDFDNENDESHSRIKAKQAKEKPGVLEYTTKLRENGYMNYSDIGEEDKEEEEVESMDKPYIIKPEEFGEFGSYETISLNYYVDQILADENDELVEDVDSVVGLESLKHFGEYEDDSVFVRNKRLKCDYEILLDQRAYSDIINKKPHQGDV